MVSLDQDSFTFERVKERIYNATPFVTMKSKEAKLYHIRG